MLPPSCVSTAVSTEPWPAGFVWCNVLVTRHYIDAPTSSTGGANKKFSGIFTCPSANPDLQVGVSFATYTGPAAGTAPNQGDNDKYVSAQYDADAITSATGSGIVVSSHYILNAYQAASFNILSNVSPPTTSQFVTPFAIFNDNIALGTRSRVKDPTYKRTLSAMKSPSTLVMILEGNTGRLFCAGDLAARHGPKFGNRNATTNFAFFDGHIASFSTKPYDDGDLGPPVTARAGLLYVNHKVAETKFYLKE